VKPGEIIDTNDPRSFPAGLDFFCMTCRRSYDGWNRLQTHEGCTFNPDRVPSPPETQPGVNLTP
jgi:hypothetical protein